MSERRSVLIVDDEPDLLELLEVNLARAGFQTATARNGREALSLVEQSPPDLVLLDIMMPELSGTEVASRLRAKPTTASIPIIMLTAKGEEVDEIVGLTVGADDYVTKPFSTKVLLARIEAVLRRAHSGEGPTSDSLTRLGPISINEETHEAWCDAEALKLTLTEFRLLAALVDAGGKVLSRAALMSKAMGPGVTVTERTIDVHVTSIRKKLGEHAGVIHTVRGVGYKATPPAHVDAEVQ
ncbi:MAG: response regulator transcription factor [Planctomycetota bacterium]